MINLLPPKEKESIVYGRYNTQLRLWIMGALVGLAGVVAVVFGGRMFVLQSAQNYEKSIAESKARLAGQKQTETLEQVKEIQQSFKLVVDVLSREVLFSKLLPRVGQVMPSGTVLEDLSLNVTGTETAFDLTAGARDFISGSQIQVNLTDPNNKLFAKADLVDVACPKEQDEPTEYPCKVTMRVLPVESNQFLLISPEDKP